jgi:hypothetical protein
VMVWIAMLEKPESPSLRRDAAPVRDPDEY